MEDALPGSEPTALTLLPETEARLALAARPLSFRLLAPPFRALGVGRLRVLRVVEGPELTELVAGYERYERLPDVVPPQPANRALAAR
jgi:hypothetical protein